MALPVRWRVGGCDRRLLSGAYPVQRPTEV